MTSSSISFTVIGGFLGAGKTTVLNHVLSSPDIPRLAVLVNDFGAINLDASLIASQHGETMALTNGCVCCSIGDDLSAALIQVLQAQPPFDGIVVEASGVSDPWRIAQIGLADPDIRLDGVVVLIDATALLQQARDPRLADSLQAQVGHADLLVVNKSSQATEANRAAIAAWCQQHAPSATVIWTDHGVVDPDVVLGNWAAQRPARSAESTPDLPATATANATAAAAIATPSTLATPANSTAQLRFGNRPMRPRAEHSLQFESWEMRLPQAMPQATADALRDPLNALSTGILRLKALVRTPNGWIDVQLAGRHVAVRRHPSARFDADSAGVVAIGLRGELPVSQLKLLFAAAA